MIGIGIDAGGPEYLDQTCVVCAISNGAMSLARDLRTIGYDDGTKAWINTVFVVPGSISKPDFRGLKPGQFSQKRKGLVVMIAVPEAVALGEGVPEFVAASLRSPAQMAAAHFYLKGIGFPDDEAELLIAGIEAHLTAPSIAVH